MEDHNKTRDELIRELKQLRSQLDEKDQSSHAASANLEQLNTLTKVAETLINVHDFATLWPRVKTAVQQTLQPDRMAVYLYDNETHTLNCPFSYGLSKSFTDQANEMISKAPGNTQFYRLTPLWTEDAQTDPNFAKAHQRLRNEGIHTLAVFPLIHSKGRAGGAMALYWNEKRPLSAENISTGFTLAHMIALALSTITLFDQTNQSLLREKQLNEISRMLSTTLDLPNLLSNIVKLVADLVRADGGLLGLVIDRDIMTFYPYNVPNWMNLRPAPRPRGLAWQIVDTCEPVLLTDYPSHPEAMQKWVEAGVLTFLGVPLRAGTNCLGMLALFNLHKSPRIFNERDLDLVESIGQQAGIAIQNLRLIAETQQRAAALAATLNRQAELDLMKNNFTQSVSHELRSPLGIIYGHAELLVSESLGSLNDEQKESGEIIMRRVLMLTNLVDDLTALLAAETQELRREEIDTIMLLYSLLADYRMRADELNISLEADIEEKIPWILGDSTHLRRVFDNLVSNAFKFTPANGRIILRLKAVGEDVEIEVEDSGEGIPEDQLNRIFERFYQVEGGSKRRHKGTGLGLTLVKEIVEAHRGTVSVRSEVGKGTIFTILIPGFWPD
ncbi:MAG: GAF domain-containing sensor histidine kinase [Ardenticatenaceae bacterium]|nr:GAF domain-containing sensor histidine kinase [Ardenticatenaceae bacterium]